MIKSELCNKKEYRSHSVKEFLTSPVKDRYFRECGRDTCEHRNPMYYNSWLVAGAHTMLVHPSFKMSYTPWVKRFLSGNSLHDNSSVLIECTIGYKNYDSDSFDDISYRVLK